MKTPGDYALDHANGKPWADIIAEIRAEAVAAACCAPDEYPCNDLSLLEDDE